MTFCPKCGSGQILGPRFETGCQSGVHFYKGERLRFTCYQCGYSMTTPTKDQVERPASDAGRK